MKDEEHKEQVKFVQWTKRNAEKHPELALLFAIPNGGKRHIAVASKMKLEGVKAGVPDLFLPVPRHEKHGLFIEMKRKDGGALSEVQKVWKKLLKEQGFGYGLAHGFEEAKYIIRRYLDI